MHQLLIRVLHQKDFGSQRSTDGGINIRNNDVFACCVVLADDFSILGTLHDVSSFVTFMMHTSNQKHSSTETSGP